MVNLRQVHSVCRVRPILLLNQGKTIPLHVWRGPNGSRRLRLPDFKTIRT